MGVTTSAMLTSNGEAGDTAFKNFGNTIWDYLDASSYPVLRNNVFDATGQSVHWAAGLLRLASFDNMSFLGGNVIQESITLSSVEVGVLGVLDVNAEATNDALTRVDFFDCVFNDDDSTFIIQTPSVNNTQVTLKIQAEDTTYEGMVSGDANCQISLSSAPAAGEILVLEAVINKGEPDDDGYYQYTRRFEIIFE